MYNQTPTAAGMSRRMPNPHLKQTTLDMLCVTYQTNALPPLFFVISVSLVSRFQLQITLIITRKTHDKLKFVKLIVLVAALATDSRSPRWRASPVIYGRLLVYLCPPHLERKRAFPVVLQPSNAPFRNYVKLSIVSLSAGAITILLYSVYSHVVFVFHNCPRPWLRRPDDNRSLPGASEACYMNSQSNGYEGIVSARIVLQNIQSNQIRIYRRNRRQTMHVFCNRAGKRRTAPPQEEDRARDQGMV